MCVCVYCSCSNVLQLLRVYAALRYVCVCWSCGSVGINLTDVLQLGLSWNELGIFWNLSRVIFDKILNTKVFWHDINPSFDKHLKYNRLQHDATHHNTLQHAAECCTMLQHTTAIATHLLKLCEPLYMYVCMYNCLCVYRCMHTYTYTYMYSYVYACKSSIYIYIYKYIYMFVYIYINT